MRNQLKYFYIVKFFERYFKKETMPVFSRLLADHITSLLSFHYPKIKTQQCGSKYKGGIVKKFTYTLCDTAEPFQIDSFIAAVRTILTRFKINFAMGCILRNESNLKYYHPSDNNGCICSKAFDVSTENDLIWFKSEFEKGNWLASTSHLNLRSDTKSFVECLANICFYVYIVDGLHVYCRRYISICR